jgi:PAS domain S-box-containing protein
MYWSDEVYRIYGFKPQEFEVTPETFKDLLHPDDIQHISNAYKDSLKNTTKYDNIHRVIPKDGKAKYVHERCNHIFDDKEDHIFSIGTVADVTEMVEKENQIKLQNEKLNALNVSKDKFFSIIAHDLRSPLGSTLQLMEILLDKNDTEQIKEIFGSIIESTKLTYGLLENLLEWSRIQTDSIEIKKERINLKELINEVIDLFEINSKKKNIYVSVISDKDYFVFADKNMILSVLRNLLSNAIKYSPSGGSVKVLFEEQLNSNNENYVKIIVLDSGVGIEQKDINNLFKIENSTSTIGTDGEKGSGLGLILCKEFIKKNGGGIFVESVVGKGSKFIITLPSADPQ